MLPAASKVPGTHPQILGPGMIWPWKCRFAEGQVKWKRNSWEIKEKNVWEWTFTWIHHRNANLLKNQGSSRDSTEVAQGMEFTPKGQEYHWPELNQNQKLSGQKHCQQINPILSQPQNSASEGRLESTKVLCSSSSVKASTELQYLFCTGSMDAFCCAHSCSNKKKVGKSLEEV